MVVPFAKTNIEVADPLAVEQYRGAFMFRGSAIHKFRIKRLFTLLGKETILALAPDQICLSEAYSSFVPHVDVGAFAKLNIYVQPANGITRFWRKKPEAKAKMSQFYIENFKSELHIPNQFDVTDLEPNGEFCALVGEAYLLDVSQVHSVDLKPGSTRSFVQLSWFNTPFDKVLERLRTLKLV